MPCPKSKGSENQNIRVAVRCRPLNDKEKRNGSWKCVDCVTDKHEIKVQEKPHSGSTTKTFSFDKVFGPNAKQIEIYKSIVMPVLEEVLMGYNCTIFAYGQTGAGKTYTMEGERTPEGRFSWEDDPLSGIIPRTLHQLFHRLQSQVGQEIEHSVRVSYLELYNEELFDLLSSNEENPRMRIFDDASRKGSVVIQGLEEVTVHSRDEVFNILQKGAAKRRFAETLMNAHSSRSHCVFMVTIHIKESSMEGEELLKIGKLNLVDLAGSENIGRSGAVDRRAREAGNINQSLLTLGRVITALVEHAPHVPYRESKLTRLLQDSLGGRTKTTLIASISPASCNLEETLSTLDYAHRAKNITNRPEINQKYSKKALIREYTEELERLRRDLQATRDKNGIYLDTENYQAMQTDLQQQRDKILDLEDKLKLTTDDFIKVSEMFSMTKQELDETSQILEVTAKDLEDTTDQLKQTAINLHKTSIAHDEQKHLVKEHVKTEHELYNQASELLKTADASTTDVTGLHAKLGRKMAVEEHNKEAENIFVMNFREQLANMSSSLLQFTLKQSDFVQRWNNDIEQCMTQKSNEVQELSQNLSQIFSNVQECSKCMCQKQRELSQKNQSFTTRTVENYRQSQESTIVDLRNFHEETMVPGTNAIQQRFCDLAEDLQDLSKTFQNRLNDHEKQLTHFVETHSQIVSEAEHVLKSYTQKFGEQLQGQEDLTQSLLKDAELQLKECLENKLKVQLKAEIDRLVDGVFTSHHETRLHVGSMISEKYNETKEVLNDMDTSITSALNSVQKVTTETEVSHKALWVNDIRDARQQLSKLAEHSELGEEDTVSLLDNVLTYKESQEKKIMSETSEAINSISTHSETVTDYINQLDNDHESMVSSTEKHVNSLHSALAKEQDAFMEHCKENLSSLQSQETIIGEWSNEMEYAIGSRENDVFHFLQKELRQDKPTGLTPQRRDFKYPKRLVKTNPHDKLLSEFRENLMKEEVQHATTVPLPDDSLVSLDSMVSDSGRGSVNDLPSLDVDGQDKESDKESIDSAFTEDEKKPTIKEIIEKEGKENSMNVKSAKKSKQPTKGTPGSRRTVPQDRTPVGSRSSRLPLRNNNNN